MRSTAFIGLLGCVCSLATVSVAQPIAQERRQPAAPAKPPRDILTIYSAGLEQLAPDPKDHGLLRALRMLEQRVLELPAETQQRHMPAAAIQLALELLRSPMTVRVGALPGLEPPVPGAPPIYAQLSFMARDQQQADSFAGRFTGTFAGMLPPGQGPAGPTLPGLTTTNVKGASLHYGATKVGGQPAFVIGLNRVDAAAPVLEGLGLPQGIQPALALVFDGREAQPLIETALAHARGGDAQHARAHAEMMGLLGPDASVVTVAGGHGKDRAHLAARMTNVGRTMRNNQMMPQRMLSAADLQRVPADAAFAKVSAYNFGSMLNVFMKSIPPEHLEGRDPLEVIESQTGIHPQRDILDHLGQVAGVYTSDSTGGAGLFSLAGFIELKNAEALEQSLTRMTAMMNQMAQQHAKGYVRISERTVAAPGGERRIRTLNFPGLPVPVEISVAIADGLLYAALNPQGLLSAIEQGRAGKGGLPDNPRFRDAAGASIDGAMQVQFYDTPRLLKDGYGLANLALAALANAVRSPADPTRDPGLILPSLAQLSAGAKAAAYITRIQGDDLLITGQCDRSWLVLGTGTLGMAGGAGGIVAPAMMAGVLLPALAKARESARHARNRAMGDGDEDGDEEMPVVEDDDEDEEHPEHDNGDRADLPAISRERYQGPAVRVQALALQTFPEQNSINIELTAPTGGWTLEFDQGQVVNGVARVFVTLERPGERERVTQALETHRTSFRTTQPVKSAEVYVHLAQRGVQTLTTDYRLAAKSQ